MQQRPTFERMPEADAVDTAPDRTLRLLPRPHSAAKLAAMDAALHAPKRSGYATRAKVLASSAAIAVAVTIPDLSLGAMGTPYTRIYLGEPMAQLPASVWTPSARSTGPVYAQVMAAEAIAPSAVTFSSRSAYGDFNRTMPLSILEAGSERFDLAFAGIELPRLDTIPLALEPLARRQRPPLVAPQLVEAAPPPRAHLVTMPQATVSRGFRPAPTPGLSFSTPSLAPALTAERSVAATNESIEAAFAGAIDVSGAVRSSIPVASPRPPNRPETVSEPVARAVPVRTPEPALSASVAPPIELVQKTQLDARVNGVLAGSVDFRQLDGTIAIRLGSVLDMLRDRYSASEFERLSAGQSSNTFVTLGALQAAGIPISYNPAYDEVEFGIDYQDAPQAAKVQVEQIGAPTLSPESVMIDQIIPR